MGEFVCILVGHFVSKYHVGDLVGEFVGVLVGDIVGYNVYDFVGFIVCNIVGNFVGLVGVESWCCYG